MAADLQILSVTSDDGRETNLGYRRATMVDENQFGIRTEKICLDIISIFTITGMFPIPTGASLQVWMSQNGRR